MKVCQKCGATENEKEFVGEFCIDCFLADNPDLVRFKKMKIEMCPRCGRVRIHNKWKRPTRDVLLGYVKSRIATELENLNVKINKFRIAGNELNLDLHICGLINGSKICINKEIKINVKLVQCPMCSKKTGEYWEAKLQIRGDNKSVKKALEDVSKLNAKISQSDSRGEIFRAEVVKTGVDVYLGSKKIAKDLVKRLKNKFNAEVKRTRKLVGEDVHRGKRIYKETYSVRLG